MDASRSSIFRYTPRTDFFFFFFRTATEQAAAAAPSADHVSQGGAVIAAKELLVCPRLSDIITPVSFIALNNAGSPVQLETVIANCDVFHEFGGVDCKVELPCKINHNPRYFSVLWRLRRP